MLAVLLDVLVVSALSALLVGTALYDSGCRFRAVRSLHITGLLAQWSFFAPTPGIQNLYLLYRDVHVGGEATVWRIVHDMDAYRGLWTCVWNPRRRLRKALHDLITGLRIERSGEHPELFKLSTPYLLIVHHLSSLPRLSGAWATEFLITVSDPYDVSNVAFQSDLHRL